MFKIYFISAVFLLTLLASNCFAQDIHFSQFYESPLTMNPALCGLFNGDEYVELNYKNQWGSVMGSGYGYNTVAAAGEIHNIIKNWKNAYLSPGFSVYSDKSGDAKVGVTEINLTVASGVSIDSRNTLAAGLQGGWGEHSITTSGLEWGSQYNPATSSGYDPNLPGDPMSGNSFSYADFSGGITWNYVTASTKMVSNDYFRINAGAAVFHINQPDQTFYGTYDPSMAGVKLYMRWVGHALVEYSIPNSNMQLIPSVVYYLQGPAQETDFGLKVRYILRQDSKYTGYVKGAALDLGGYYRVGDAFIPMVQVEFSNYAIGISYDVNVSSLTTATSGAGGFEISLRFINPNPFSGGAHPVTHSKF